MEQLCINEYFNKKGITIVGQYFNYDKNIQNKDIKSQIKLIVEVHKTLIGCNFNKGSRIRSIIGKEVEDYKVQIKNLQRHYDYVVSKSSPNEVDKLILSDGKMMLKQGNDALNHIYGHDYLGVIRRSMNREEICIGKIDRNNLRKNEGKIEIGIVKDLTYNLVEEDLYNYIKKLQRKEFNIDEEELIRLFIHESHLSFNSFDYLRGLCSYPKDFFRIWEKYKDRKKERTNGEILLELKKSLKYESKSFIL